MANPQNPHNEPCIQMLLDAIAVAIERKKPQSEIDKLKSALNVLNSDPALSNHTNQRWYAHRVPDNSVQYIQTKTLDKCYARYDMLTAEEEHILSLLERIQDPATGLVQIKKSYITDLCHMSQRETRKIQQYLDRLEELGFITYLFKPRRGSKSYGVVKINQNLSWIGSNKGISDVQLNVKGKVRYKQAAAYIVIDGQKMRCGTLEHCEITEKNEADAANANPTQDSHSPIIHQEYDNCTCEKRQADFDTAYNISLTEFPEIEPEGVKNESE